MRSSIECLHCATHGFFSLLKKVSGTEEEKGAIVRDVLTFLAGTDLSMPPVEVSMNIHRMIKKRLQMDDIHKNAKERANSQMMKMYAELEKIGGADNYEKMKNLLFHAVSANCIDFGPREHTIDFEAVLKRVKQEGFAVDQSRELFETLSHCKNVAYLLDNAGEAVMDMALIRFLRTIMPQLRITAVVRGYPVLNDMTMDDAVAIGLDKVAHHLIDNGSDAPGTLLNHVSKEVSDLLENCDLVLSKGQGNFESLYGCTNEKIYFIFMIKCQMIASLIPEAHKGDLMIMRNTAE